MRFNSAFKGLTLWSTNFIYMKYKNQVHTSPKTQCLHHKDRKLMKCNELITVCCKKYTTHTKRCNVWRKFRVLECYNTMWKACLIWWLLCYVAYYHIAEFNSRFMPKTSSRRTTYPVHSSLLEFKAVITSGEEQNLWSSSLRGFSKFQKVLNKNVLVC
jgi:hypothetical protein